MFIKYYGYSTFDTLPLTINKHVWNEKTSLLRSSFLFFSSLILFVYTLFIYNITLKQKFNLSYTWKKKIDSVLWLQSQPITITLKKTKVNKFYTTVQRAPIAHRQWSQEQYGFSFFKFLFKADVPCKSLMFLISQTPPSMIYPPQTSLFNSSFLNFYKLVVLRRINLIII